MGVKSKSKLRALALKPPVAGAVQFWLDGPPPTVTHHAKEIIRLGGRLGLKNSDRLRAAHEWHAMRIPPIDQPIAGPLIAHVTWYFPLPDKPLPGEVVGGDMQRKPDRENLAKVLFDSLERAGWIENDSKVTRGPLTKFWTETKYAGIRIYLRTVLISDDQKPILIGRNGAFRSYAYLAAKGII